MSDLHLTNDQFAQLPSMGPLGVEAHVGLEFWRAATEGPWCTMGLPGYVWVALDRHNNIDELFSCESGDPETKTMKAIVYARNTAELRAAMAYHTLRLANINNDIITDGMISEYGPQIMESQEQIQAIYEALKKIRHGSE